MIDEYFDNLVDRWCQIIPKYMKPRMIRISNSSIGWRMQLYFGTLGRNIARLFSRMSTEEQMDITLREGSEQIDDSLAKIAAFFRELGSRSGIPRELLVPLYKTVGIALVVKIGGGLCADAGEKALTAVVETAGAVCALAAALPLLQAVLDLMTELMA